MELTDQQIKCLLICDAIRWNQKEILGPYNYHLLRRQLALQDPVVQFEWEQAGNFALSYDLEPPEMPPLGPQRSPWISTYQVPLERAYSIDPMPPDLSEFSPSA